MAGLVRFLKRRGRLLVLAAFACVLFALWLPVLWRVLPVRPLRTLQPGESKVVLSGFSADGSILYYWSPRPKSGRWRLLQCDVASGQCSDVPGDIDPTTITQIDMPRKRCLRISPVGINEHEIKLIEFGAGRTPRTAVHKGSLDASTCRFSPDGRWLTWAHFEDAGVPCAEVYDLDAMASRWVFRNQRWPGTFSNTGRLLATQEETGQVGSAPINIWDLETGTKAATFAASDSDASIEFTPDDGAIFVVELSRDSLLLTGTPTLNVFDRTLWDLKTGEGRRCLPGHALAIDSRRVVSEPTFSPTGDSSALEMHDITTGELLWSIPADKDERTDVRKQLQIGAKRVLAVRLRIKDADLGWLNRLWNQGASPPDGRPMLRLIDVDTGRIKATLPVAVGQSDHVFAANGARLAVIDDARIVQIWDLPPRRPVALLLTLAALPALLFTALLWWRLGR